MDNTGENFALDTEREIQAKRHRKSSPFTQIHRYTSLKTGERLSGEGHNERDFWLWCDGRPNIRMLFTELDSVQINRNRRYTADACLVTHDNERMYIEVKSDRAAEGRKFQEAFAEKVAFYAEHGQTLRLVTRSDFPSRNYMTNLKLLYIYVTGEPPTKEELSTLADVLPPGASATFGTLRQSLARRHMTPHAVWHGLATGDLVTDLERPITTHSTITRRKSLCK